MATLRAPVTADDLAKMELFLGLPAEALAHIGTTGRVRSLPKGTVLFTQGAHADRCHAVISGRLRISQAGAQGHQLIVRFIGPGEMFGTLALFTDRRYPADAVTMIDSVEISWTESVLLELIHRYPKIALNLVRIAAARLREAQQRLRELATERVDSRIAHALLRLAGPGVFQGGAGAAIDFPLTREDVAAISGATLYTASRILKSWERAGYITTHRKRLTIHQLAEIRRIAERSPE